MQNVQYARMIPRRALRKVEEALNRQAAVALVGPRQVGKTTLAFAVAEDTDALYLDLEAREDRAKLSEPALFLQEGRLIAPKRRILFDECIGKPVMHNLLAHVTKDVELHHIIDMKIIKAFISISLLNTTY